MVKSVRLVVMVEPEFQKRVNTMSEKTGVPYSEVVRRSLETWLATGEMPPMQPAAAQLATLKGGKRSAAKRKA
jgi:predicted DNA-binding protein